MKALVKTAPGPGNLELREIPIPQIGDNDLLIKVSCCGICGSDLHIEAGIHPSMPPVVIGHEFSGVVASIGKNVKGFKTGDPVSFLKGWNPFPGVGADGGFAEYLRAPADCMWKTPEGVTQEEASQFETITTPMRLIRDEARVVPGDRVVVTGVGMIGLSTIAVAAIEGAEVYAVGTAQDCDYRLPLAKELGALKTLVFGEETLMEIERWGPSKWIECSGAAEAIEAASNLIQYSGLILSPGMGKGPWNVNVARMTYNNITLKGIWGGNIDYIREFAGWMQTGKLNIKPLLKTMLLSQWREAFDMLKRQQGIKVLLVPDANL